ncbi:uncharacterized protein A1O9_05384 [Exophiala aquamarina CBS 119918]|uniref:Hydantoinase A/oxoprolinase domain-containing protein n=1 Tax=Exophiala aquamarina CBS 119918 TaxID=1182545 RepID=A0A072PCG7_9EURO|nr:uncharacterized protein A1O9_05384 [Exophiala aquamarina CBS 119918]KEF57467.1 hypothetical protein A1O9_05384 [Exophiala aquamarina CBS 119918]
MRLDVLYRSEPAGGVQGVVDVIANQTPYKNPFTLDMGGASTDCASISNSSASVRQEHLVGNLAVKAPSVDVRTVGTRGGSESAGATPGPACYGKEGTKVTVSDANLVLGYLPAELLAGDFSLDVETAEGIIDLVAETIYSALRVVPVEFGYDPADFAIVAFGGVGPLHATAFSFSLPSFELEFMRLRVIATHSSPCQGPGAGKAWFRGGEHSSRLGRHEPKAHHRTGKDDPGHVLGPATVDEERVSYPRPSDITEMDSNTLILPGFVGTIDGVGNILITPADETSLSVGLRLALAESTKEKISKASLISTVIASSLASTRNEMNTPMLRCANAEGQILVGQFGSFTPSFLSFWKREINEGDIFVTNDVCQVAGAVTCHRPHAHSPSREACRLGRQFWTFDVPGTLTIGSTIVYDDGVQIPVVKLETKTSKPFIMFV